MKSIGFLSIAVIWLFASIKGNLFAGKIPKESQLFFVSEYETILYLFPDRKKEAIGNLRVLDTVERQQSPIELPSSEWIYVKTKSELAGYALRKNLLAIQKTPFQSLNQIFGNQINRKSLAFVYKMNLTDALFDLTENGEFWKDDFLYVRALGAVALGEAIGQMNEEKIKPNQTTEIQGFLKRHESKLLYDFNRNVFYVDSNFFWKLIEASPSTKHADYLAFQAVEAMPKINCEKNLFCELESVRKGKLKFLYFFPQSKYSKPYFASVKNTLQNLTLEPESIACFEDADASIPSEIRMISRYVESLPSQYKSKLNPYLHILKSECLKE